TLLNHLVGQKISITSRKPQTTRHRILGVSTREDVQVVYVDTPGLHGAGGRALNRAMNRAALSALRDVDLVLMVVDGLKWTELDERVLAEVAHSGKPAMLLLNKVDLLAEKDALLPHIDGLQKRHAFRAIVP